MKSSWQASYAARCGVPMCVPAQIAMARDAAVTSEFKGGEEGVGRVESVLVLRNREMHKPYSNTTTNHSRGILQSLALY